MMLKCSSLTNRGQMLKNAQGLSRGLWIRQDKTGQKLEGLWEGQVSLNDFGGEKLCDLHRLRTVDADVEERNGSG